MATSVAQKGRLATGKEPRADKAEAVEALHQRFKENTSLVLFDYCGLNVSQMTALRRQTRAAGIQFSIVKNTIAERAVKGTDFEEIGGRLTGPISIATTDGDPSVPARLLTEFVKEESKGEIKGGVLDGRLLEAADVEMLADLPPREVLLSKMVGSMEGPVSSLPRLLNTLLGQLVNVMGAIAKKKE